MECANGEIKTDYNSCVNTIFPRSVILAIITASNRKNQVYFTLPGNFAANYFMFPFRSGILLFQIFSKKLFQLIKRNRIFSTAVI